MQANVLLCYPIAMSTHYMSEEQFALVQRANADNLAAWKHSGVVNSLKWYSAEDEDVCPACRAHDGRIIPISDAKLGVNLPPHEACISTRCRCYFRPSDISIV